MFDFDEIEEVVATKGELGRKDDPPVAPKAQPKPPVDDDDDDPFGGMCRPDPPKPAPAVQDDDDDDPFGGMTRSDPHPSSTKVVVDDDDDDDPFGGMVRKDTPTAKSGGSEKCVITVRYRHKSQRWTHEYELASGATVLDLKKKITAAEPDQAGFFRLLRNSVPLRDEDKLTKSEKLDFLYDVPRKSTAQKGNEEELEITITLAAVFGIRTTMKVPKGLTVKALKELMVKQDPTNATTLGSFELMQDGGGRLLNDDEEIPSNHLTLCPCKGG
jgi:hypothetical protein